MEQTKFSLDDFLEEEKSVLSDLLVIIELDEQNKNNVKISPWNKNGCNCDDKFSIAKNLVESVEKTNETHYCCGKTHTVVKVNFIKDAAIQIEDLLGQLAKNNNIPNHLMQHRNTTDLFELNWNPICIEAEIIRKRCSYFPDGPGSRDFAYFQIYRNKFTGKKCGEKQISSCNGLFGDGNG